MRSFWSAILIVILVTSCQNRNHVTHHKRKYTKGYYNLKRKNLRHQVTKSTEDHKISPEVASNKREGTGRVSSENHPNLGLHEAADNTMPVEKEKHPLNTTKPLRSKTPVTIEDSTKNEEQEKLTKLKMATFFSLLVPTPTFFLGFATAVYILWPIGMLVGTLTGLIFSIFYLKKSIKLKSKKDKRKAIFAIVLFSVFFILAILWLATGFTIDFY